MYFSFAFQNNNDPTYLIFVYLDIIYFSQVYWFTTPQKFTVSEH